MNKAELTDRINLVIDSCVTMDQLHTAEVYMENAVSYGKKRGIVFDAWADYGAFLDRIGWKHADIFDERIAERNAVILNDRLSKINDMWSTDD